MAAKKLSKPKPKDRVVLDVKSTSSSETEPGINRRRSNDRSSVTKSRLRAVKRTAVKVEYDLEQNNVTVVKQERQDCAATPAPATTSTTGPGGQIDTVTVDMKTITNAKNLKWEPQNWRQQLANINDMRKHRDAPVDTMGCDRISDTRAEPKVH